ncbi:MAG: hypothetical protein J6D06_09760 [Clostridia bacterium]|nr:hypothetical protein [Clostridia bacterium]
MKKIIGLLLAASLLLTCSGCSLNFFSVESLLSPPMQSGKNGEVQEAFNTLMKKEKIQLKTPLAGDYQTSFVLFDVNDDQNDEAFIFYTDASVDASVRMAFLQCIDNEWQIAADIKGGGNGVYDIAFSDMNNDGLSEIFVSWSLFDSKVKKITGVYLPAMSENGVLTLKSLGSEYCDARGFVDFNGDTEKDFVVVYHDDTGDTQKTFLRLFSLSKSYELVKYGEIPLDSAITSVSRIQSDVISINGDKITRLFIDCQKSEKMIFTEMVYWNSELSVPVRAISKPSLSNTRSYKVSSMDVDGDGLLEIPVITSLAGDEKQFSVSYYDEVYTFTLLEWKNLKGDNDNQTLKTLSNPLDEYLLLFPWEGEVSVKYDSVRDALVYYEWKESEHEYGDELFAIAQRDSDEKFENNNILYKDDNTAYFFEITQQGVSFGVTADLLKQNFIKI